MVLNEKVFRRGKETKALPVLMIVGASNHLPEDEALQALFDRFLIRVHCDNVDPESLQEVLEAGWKLEATNHRESGQVSAEQISQIQSLISTVDLQEIRSLYMELISKLRNAGIALSDRRAVKLQRLIAASALLCKRTKAIPSDMWVLRYIWDTEEQQEVIAGIVNSVVETHKDQAGQHPRASVNSLPNADDIFKEVSVLNQKWETPDVSPADRTLIKDRLRYLNGRCQWIDNDVQRQYVQGPIDQLWQKILQTA
jgi:MoxR-like ATPase